MGEVVVRRGGNEFEALQSIFRQTLGDPAKSIGELGYANDWSTETILANLWKSYEGINKRLYQTILHGMPKNLDWTDIVAPPKTKDQLGIGFEWNRDRVRSAIMNFNVRMAEVKGPRTPARLIDFTRETREARVILRGSAVEFDPMAWTDTIKRDAVLWAVLNIGLNLKSAWRAVAAGTLLFQAAVLQDKELAEEGPFTLKKFYEEWNKQCQRTYALNKQGVGFPGLLEEAQSKLHIRNVPKTDFIVLSQGVHHHVSEVACNNRYIDPAQKPLRETKEDYQNPDEVAVGLTKNGKRVYENKPAKDTGGFKYDDFVQYKEFGQFFADYGNTRLNPRGATRYLSSHRTIRLWNYERGTRFELTPLKGLEYAGVFDRDRKLLARGVQLLLAAICFDEKSGTVVRPDELPWMAGEPWSSAPGGADRKSGRRRDGDLHKHRLPGDDDSDESDDDDAGGGGGGAGISSGGLHAYCRQFSEYMTPDFTCHYSAIENSAKIGLMRLYYLARACGVNEFDTMVYQLRCLNRTLYARLLQCGRCDDYGRAGGGGGGSSGAFPGCGPSRAPAAAPAVRTSPPFILPELDESPDVEFKHKEVMEVTLPLAQAASLPLPRITSDDDTLRVENRVQYRTGAEDVDAKQVLQRVIVKLMDAICRVVERAQEVPVDAHNQLENEIGNLAKDADLKWLFGFKDMSVPRITVLGHILHLSLYLLIRRPNNDLSDEKILDTRTTWSALGNAAATARQSTLKKLMESKDYLFEKLHDLKDVKNGLRADPKVNIPLAGHPVAGPQNGPSQLIMNILPLSEQKTLHDAVARLNADQKKHLETLSKSFAKLVAQNDDITSEMRRAFKATVAAWIRDPAVLTQVVEAGNTDAYDVMSAAEARPQEYLSAEEMAGNRVVKKSKTGGGGGDDDPILSGPVPQRDAQTVIADMKRICLEYEVFAFIYHNDILFPVGFLYTRPFFQTRAACMLTGLGGEQTAVTTLLDPLALIALSPQTKTNVITFEAKSATLVRQPQNMFAAIGVASLGEVQGAGEDFMDPSNSVDQRNMKQKERLRSMFSFLIPYRFQYKETVLDITGRFNPQYVIDADQGPLPQFPTATTYRKYWSFSYGPDSPFSLQACTIDRRGFNTVCTLATHWRCVHSSMGDVREERVVGKDPCGDAETEGNVEPIRTGGKYQRVAGSMPEQPVYGYSSR